MAMITEISKNKSSDSRLTIRLPENEKLFIKIQSENRKISMSKIVSHLIRHCLTSKTEIRK